MALIVIRIINLPYDSGRFKAHFRYHPEKRSMGLHAIAATVQFSVIFSYL